MNCFCGEKDCHHNVRRETPVLQPHCIVCGLSDCDHWPYGYERIWREGK